MSTVGCYINPDTQRPVKATSRKGKKLGKQGIPLIQCPVNPKTGRILKPGARVSRKLARQGVAVASVPSVRPARPPRPAPPPLEPIARPVQEAPGFDFPIPESPPASPVRPPAPKPKPRRRPRPQVQAQRTLPTGEVAKVYTPAQLKRECKRLRKEEKLKKKEEEEARIQADMKIRELAEKALVTQQMEAEEDYAEDPSPEAAQEVKSVEQMQEQLDKAIYDKYIAEHKELDAEERELGISKTNGVLVDSGDTIIEIEDGNWDAVASLLAKRKERIEDEKEPEEEYDTAEEKRKIEQEEMEADELRLRLEALAEQGDPEAAPDYAMTVHGRYIDSEEEPIIKPPEPVATNVKEYKEHIDERNEERKQGDAPIPTFLDKTDISGFEDMAQNIIKDQIQNTTPDVTATQADNMAETIVDNLPADDIAMVVADDIRSNLVEQLEEEKGEEAKTIADLKMLNDFEAKIAQEIGLTYYPKRNPVIQEENETKREAYFDTSKRLAQIEAERGFSNNPDTQEDQLQTTNAIRADNFALADDIMDRRTNRMYKGKKKPSEQWSKITQKEMERLQPVAPPRPRKETVPQKPKKRKKPLKPFNTRLLDTLFLKLVAKGGFKLVSNPNKIIDALNKMGYGLNSAMEEYVTKWYRRKVGDKIGDKKFFPSTRIIKALVMRNLDKDGRSKSSSEINEMLKLSKHWKTNRQVLSIIKKIVREIDPQADKRYKIYKQTAADIQQVTTDEDKPEFTPTPKPRRRKKKRKQKGLPPPEQLEEEEDPYGAGSFRPLKRRRRKYLFNKNSPSLIDEMYV